MRSGGGRTRGPRDNEPMSLVIRRAEPADLDTIGEITVRAYVEGGFTRPDADYVATLADARSRADGAELWVAVSSDGAVLGSVCCAPPGSAFNEIPAPAEAEMRMLAVSPEAQGGGVGEALARHCIQRARALGLSALALSSLPSMHAAHRIYERLGFVRKPDRDWSPVPGIELIAYRLDLTQGG